MTKPPEEIASYYENVPSRATYRTDWTCDNCFTKFAKDIKKGVRRPAKVDCPNCGCDTDGKIYGRV